MAVSADQDQSLTVPGIGSLSLSDLTHPLALFLLAVPAALLASYVRAQVLRRRRLRRFTTSAMLPAISPQPPHPLRHMSIAAALVSLVLLVFALAQPTHPTKIPRNRAVVMLVVDVSESMAAKDVPPTRLDAARQAAKQFAERLTPGVNLGLVSFAGNSNLLVSPVPDHGATMDALDRMKLDNGTATGEAIFTALQAITTVTAVLTSEQAEPPPARIVLLSDGLENRPENPNNPRGAFTAARFAKDQGVPISTITFGTPGGFTRLKDKSVPVPVNGDEMREIARLSGGQTYEASSLDQLEKSYSGVLEQIGYQTMSAPSGAAWLRLGALALAIAMPAALAVNRDFPL